MKGKAVNKFIKELNKRISSRYEDIIAEFSKSTTWAKFYLTGFGTYAHSNMYEYIKDTPKDYVFQADDLQMSKVFLTSVHGALAYQCFEDWCCSVLVSDYVNKQDKETIKRYNTLTIETLINLACQFEDEPLTELFQLHMYYCAMKLVKAVSNVLPLFCIQSGFTLLTKYDNIDLYLTRCLPKELHEDAKWYINHLENFNSTTQVLEDEDIDRIMRLREYIEQKESESKELFSCRTAYSIEIAQQIADKCIGRLRVYTLTINHMKSEENYKTQLRENENKINKLEAQYRKQNGVISKLKSQIKEPTVHKVTVKETSEEYNRLLDEVIQLRNANSKLKSHIQSLQQKQEQIKSTESPVPCKVLQQELDGDLPTQEEIVEYLNTYTVTLIGYPTGFANKIYPLLPKWKVIERTSKLKDVTIGNTDFVVMNTKFISHTLKNYVESQVGKSNIRPILTTTVNVPVLLKEIYSLLNNLQCV